MVFSGPHLPCSYGLLFRPQCPYVQGKDDIIYDEFICSELGYFCSVDIIYELTVTNSALKDSAHTRNWKIRENRFCV